MDHEMATTSKAALTARYGTGSVPKVGPWNATIELLAQHRSVRAYRDEALPDGIFETLVAAGQSAATSSNMQTWSVIAVRDAARKQRFADLAGDQPHIAQCPLFLVFVADLSRHDRMQAAEGVTLEALPYLETFLVAAIDAALAAQNVVIAAESLGLSTVYIGALRNKPLEVAAELDLPAGAMGVFGLCVGYAQDDQLPDVKPRLEQAAIAFDERYRVGDDVGMRQRYDRELAAFAARNERQPYTWTSRIKMRLGTVASLGGRDRLAELLRTLGFPLR